MKHTFIFNSAPCFALLSIGMHSQFYTREDICNLHSCSTFVQLHYPSKVSCKGRPHTCAGIGTTTQVVRLSDLMCRPMMLHWLDKLYHVMLFWLDGCKTVVLLLVLVAFSVCSRFFCALSSILESNNIELRWDGLHASCQWCAWSLGSRCNVLRQNMVTKIFFFCKNSIGLCGITF